MDENNGLLPKLNKLFTENKVRPETGIESSRRLGILGEQLYDESNIIQPLINIEDNYARYMGAPKILSQNLESDLREIRAQNQSFLETAAYGTGRFIGQTALHGVGTILAPVAFVLTGGNYDNDFTKMIDESVKKLAEFTPIYKTSAQENADFWSKENLLSDNFWFDEFAGGLSFIAGSYLAGMGLGAMGNAAKITQKMIKASKALKMSMDATKTASAIGRITRILNIGNVAAHTSMSFYEAGLQATEFKNIALEELKTKHLLKFKKEATEDEIKEYQKEVNKVANGIFMANMALVSMENVVMLNKIYGKPLKSVIPERTRLAVRDAYEYFDPLTEAPTRFAHVVKNIYKTIAAPVFEGSQEFAQSLFNEVGLEYVLGKYSPEGHNENYTLGNAFNDAFSRMKGEGGAFDEAYIGMLMGFIGLPGIATGSVSNVKQIFSKPVMGEIATAYHKFSPQDSSNILKNTAGHLARIFETNKKIERAVNFGDVFTAKTEEAKQLLSWMSSRYNSRTLDTEIENYNDTLDKMSDEEFMTEFGYEGLDSREIQERKAYMKESLNKKKKSFIKAKEIANKITVSSENHEVNEFITFNVFMNEDAKNRLEDIDNEVYKNTGLRISLGDEEDTNSQFELSAYFDDQGNPISKLPKQLDNYISEPGNYSNLVVAVADHKRLTKFRELYNESVKSMYDIENQRKLTDVIGYMKFKLLEKYANATDIAMSYIEEYQDLDQARIELENEVQNYNDFPELQKEINDEIKKIKDRLDTLKNLIEQKFKGRDTKTAERVFYIHKLLELLMSEREKFERIFDKYKPSNRTEYSGDIDNNDKLTVPKGARLGAVKRDPDTNKPTSYNYVIYNEDTETVSQKFFTRQNGVNNRFTEKPYNDNYDDSMSAIVPYFNSIGVDIKKVLKDSYGIDEKSFIGLESFSFVIKNGVAPELRIKKISADGLSIENALISFPLRASNNLKDFASIFKNMFVERNKYNNNSKVVIPKNIDLKKTNSTFPDSVLKSKNIVSVEIDLDDPNRMQEVGGIISIPSIITIRDKKTGSVSKVKGSFYFETTNMFKGGTGFDESERKKKEAIEKYEQAMEELERLKREMEKIRTGAGLKGFKVGDEATSCEI